MFGAIKQHFQRKRVTETGVGRMRDAATKINANGGCRAIVKEYTEFVFSGDNQAMLMSGTMKDEAAPYNKNTVLIACINLIMFMKTPDCLWDAKQKDYWTRSAQTSFLMAFAHLEQSDLSSVDKEELDRELVKAVGRLMNGETYIEAFSETPLVTIAGNKLGAALKAWDVWMTADASNYKRVAEI
ncbi:MULTISPECIES: hypothetical protein [unclassified Aurantimonas]|uniref:hypothetical protein n=1 Tax=unclassified Aurantimonas TaxID=2638230 RepID=UPI002E187B9E|nr:MULTISPECIES: hypothetical protein [unclassified Aurantimonas]MEC5291301.1 hypothetical protein [Aurantimonas sp. C2-3-R2]MEC5412328.1 hypothetical protein [Aurantimonas sp. C2-4-R8]